MGPKSEASGAVPGTRRPCPINARKRDRGAQSSWASRTAPNLGVRQKVANRLGFGNLRWHDADDAGSEVVAGTGPR